MIELKTRAEQFLKSIQAEGERQCAAIRRKTDTEVTQSLAAAREEEQARAARTIAFETARAKTQANRALSAARAEARAALTARRQALTDGVFDDAEARLAACTATADYAAWLQASAADLAARLGQGTVLYARPADCALLTALPAGCTLQPDDSIRLGGLRAENRAAHMAADDTLSTRLAAQRSWFLENAGLSIEL